MAGLDLGAILSIHERRVVTNHYTVRYRGQVLQIERGSIPSVPRLIIPGANPSSGQFYFAENRTFLLGVDRLWKGFWLSGYPVIGVMGEKAGPAAGASSLDRPARRRMMEPSGDQ